MLAITLLACLLAYGIGARHGAAGERKDWEIKTFAQLANDTQAARDKETEWRNETDEHRATFQARIDDIAGAYADDLERLRLRATRDSSVPKAASCGGGCATGAQLCREDAAFLVGEAARAEKLIAERDRIAADAKSVTD